jgi:hypothetical protein
MSFWTNGVKRCAVNQKELWLRGTLLEKREVNIWRLAILFMFPLWRVKSSNQIGNVPWNSILFMFPLWRVKSSNQIGNVPWNSILFMFPLWQVKSSNQIGNVPWNSQKMNWEFRVLRASPSVLSIGSCTVQLDEDKSKYGGLAQEIGFWLSIIVHYTMAGKRHSNAVHLQKTSPINMIWLLISVSDWPIIMIRPGGLLLVILNVFTVLVSVLHGWGCKRSK